LQLHFHKVILHVNVFLLHTVPPKLLILRPGFLNIAVVYRFTVVILTNTFDALAD